MASSTLHRERFDLIVIGGGIVGLTAAREFQHSYPKLSIALLEKEDRIGTHQTTHNSGVVHSGLYYKPGSAKARLCRLGSVALKQFCERHEIPFKVCGKVVVAAKADELPLLAELYRRGRENGLAGLRLLGPEELKEIEPYCVGVQALHVPEAAVVDFSRVATQVAESFASRGGEIVVNARVRSIRRVGETFRVHTSAGVFEADFLVTCCGLFSDRITRLEGGEPPGRIVPFRGEYYRLKRDSFVRALIYPVPNPRFPFLGVHFTRKINGEVEAGPNAVLALSREGYSKWQFNGRDVLDVITFPGFWKLARKHWQAGAEEIHRSISKRAFLTALQKLVPEVRADDLEPGGSGVRAQALGHDGTLIDDFAIVKRSRALHVCNAPSPAATASLAIARHIVETAQEHFGLGRAPV